MKRTSCFVALLLVGASPTRAELQLPGKCKEPELLVAAGERLATACSERIKDLEDRRKEDDTKAKILTTVSIVSGILAAGGAAALTAIPGIGTAIQAADPPRPAVGDVPSTPGAQPGPALAVSQLAVGVATGLFGASAAGFAALAVFFAPSPEEAGALQTDLNSMRAAANKLVLLPARALDDQEDANKILSDAAAKCAISDPKPRDGGAVRRATQDLMSNVSAITTMAGKAPPSQPRCLRSLEHVKELKLWVGHDASGSLVLLRYEPKDGAVTKVCSAVDKDECTEEPSAIKAFLKDFDDAMQ